MNIGNIGNIGAVTGHLLLISATLLLLLPVRRLSPLPRGVALVVCVGIGLARIGDLRLIAYPAGVLGDLSNHHTDPPGGGSREASRRRRRSPGCRSVLPSGGCCFDRTPPLLSLLGSHGSRHVFPGIRIRSVHGRAGARHDPLLALPAGSRASDFVRRAGVRPWSSHVGQHLGLSAGSRAGPFRLGMGAQHPTAPVAAPVRVARAKPQPTMMP